MGGGGGGSVSTGLVPLGVTCRGEEGHTGRTSPWGARACWEVCWDREGWRSLDSTHEECMRAGLHTSQGRDLHLAAPPNPKGQMLHPLHTTTWSRIWGRQVLEEVCQGLSSDPWRKHSHLDACSHSALALSPSQILTTARPPPQPSTPSGMDTAEKGT